jgi:hypothetical protein
MVADLPVGTHTLRVDQEICYDCGLSYINPITVATLTRKQSSTYPRRRSVRRLGREKSIATDSSNGDSR